MIEPTPFILDIMSTDTLVSLANDISREIDKVAMDNAGTGGFVPAEYSVILAKSFEMCVAQLELTIGPGETKDRINIPRYL